MTGIIAIQSPGNLVALCIARCTSDVNHNSIDRHRQPIGTAAITQGKIKHIDGLSGGIDSGIQPDRFSYRSGSGQVTIGIRHQAG